MRKFSFAFVGALLLTACGQFDNPLDIIFIASATDPDFVRGYSLDASIHAGVQEYCQNEGMQFETFLLRSDAQLNDPWSNDMGINQTFEFALSHSPKLIIVAPELSAYANRYASLFPHQKFLAINESLVPKPNTYSLLFDQQQMGYLLGYATGKEDYPFAAFFSDGSLKSANYALGYMAGFNAGKADDNWTHDFFSLTIFDKDTISSDDLLQRRNELYAGEGLYYVATAMNPTLVDPMAHASYRNGRRVFTFEYNQTDRHDIMWSEVFLNSCYFDIKQIMADFYPLIMAPAPRGLGFSQVLSAESLAFGLDESHWNFRNFTLGEYQEVFAQLQNEEIILDADPELIWNEAELRAYVTENFPNISTFDYTIIDDEESESDEPTLLN